MSDQLTRPEQLLMWQLFASGGEKLLKDIVPKPKGTHTALAKKGYLAMARHDRTRRLELEDRGWRWIADCDPFPIGAAETRVTAERRLLQSLVRSMKRYAAANGMALQDLFRVAPEPAPADPEPSAPPNAGDTLPEAIRAAFFAIAGRPPRHGVRLSALRAKLPAVPRAELDAALLAMRDDRSANLMNLDNPRDIEAEEGAELHSGRQVFHVVWIQA